MLDMITSLSTFDILFSVFLLSLPLGSFYNVVALRTLSGESYMNTDERSHCNSCRHQLHWNDLIPVVSWLMLKGKCRYCGEKVTGLYSLWELFTAISYTVIIYQFGFTIETLIQLILITILIWASVTDITARTVPKSFIAWGYILAGLLRFYTMGTTVAIYLFIAGLASFLFIIISRMAKEPIVKSDIWMIGLVFFINGPSLGANILVITGILNLLLSFIMKVKRKPLDTYLIPYITWSIFFNYLLII